MDKKASFVLQASSIGSLGKDANVWLRGELLTSFSAPTTPSSVNAMSIVFPTVQEVRNSLEGYAAGGSIPFSSLTYEKQKAMMRPLLHSWNAEHCNRSRAMPHIKTFCRVRNDNSLDWFVLTSANISKAAWGSLEKKGCQLMIRSYELGVLILPSLLTDEEVTIVSQQFKSKGGIVVPLPYNLPLTPYAMQDTPWLCDVRHNKPDLFGEQWP
jgi:tyrosyl-DNA phosphodiesterase-1